MSLSSGGRGLVARLVVVMVAAPILAAVIALDAIVRFAVIVWAFVRTEPSAYATQPAVGVESGKPTTFIAKRPTHEGTAARH